MGMGTTTISGRCLLCGEEGVTGQAGSDHLIALHGYTADQVQTARSRHVAHLDGDGFYEDHYRFEIGGRDVWFRAVRRVPRSRQVRLRV